MKVLFRGLLWLAVLLLILFGIDQLLLRVPVSRPALSAVREFYLDFRVRLLRLLPGSETPSIEAVIEQAEKTPIKRPRRAAVQRPAAQKKAAPAGAAKEPSYFYGDENGELHFVDSLQDVPKRFRKEAQRLEP